MPVEEEGKVSVEILKLRDLLRVGDNGDEASVLAVSVELSLEAAKVVDTDGGSIGEENGFLVFRAKPGFGVVGVPRSAVTALTLDPWLVNIGPVVTSNVSGVTTRIVVSVSDSEKS